MPQRKRASPYGSTAALKQDFQELADEAFTDFCRSTVAPPI
jgi:hypothetical protein